MTHGKTSRLTVGSTLDTTNGDMEVVLRVALLPSDVAEIAQRMERMALEAAVDAQVAQQQAAAAQAKVKASDDHPARVRDALRKEFNGLTDGQRSVFGSFHNFIQHRAQGLPDPWTMAPPEEPVTIPTVVWLEKGEATEQQRAMAIGIDAEGRYGVDPDDLTYEQRARRNVMRVDLPPE
jgi:hypothetical protein